MDRANYQKLNAPATNALYALEKALKDSTLEHAIVDLVKIRASQINGCLFCLDLHSKQARTRAERELRLIHLPLWRESSLFSERERAALEWTELLTRPGAQAGNADYAKLTPLFNEKEIADLTLCIASINAWNTLGIAFRAPPGSLDKVMGVEQIGLH